MTSLRILMPSASDPSTGHCGAATSTRNFIRLLETAPLGARVECLSLGAPPGRTAHRLRQAAAIGRSFLSPIPAKPAFFYSSRIRRTVGTLARNCDIVVLDGGDLLWLAPYLPDTVPRVLFAHNIEHQIFADECRDLSGRFPLLERLLRRETVRLERWEIDGIRSVDRVLFLSEDDAAQARANSWTNRSLVVPPVFFDPPAPRQATDRSGEFVEAGFLANLYWWPNREGLQWLLDRVFPQVRDRVRLHLFGPGTERFRGDDRIVGHGRIPDLSRAWATCDLMLSPVLHGSGVSVKVAEAIYHGVPLLATSPSMRGLSLPPDPCIAVLDQPEKWIDFLRSARARELRRERICPEVSACFSGPNYAAAVQEFLAQA